MVIDVIIPTYNRASLIREAVESVLCQEGQGDAFVLNKVWIIDDCSTDDTEDVIRQINDQRICYRRLEKNGGAAAARNTGVRLSDAEWIAFHDSDDTWHADKLKKQAQYLQTEPKTEMVCTNVNTKLANGQAVTIQANEVGDQVKSLASRNFVDAPTIMIKRERFLELGGFDEDMKALEDWDLALRYAEKGKIGFIQEPLLEAELLDSGVSSGAGNYFDARARMIAKNRELLAGRGCLETALLQFMEFAQNENVLPQARQLLEYYTGVYVS